MKLARAIFAVLIATAFAYTLTASAAAAGVNCIDFGGDPQAAQDFFIANGGSPTNNVEGLDRDHDGFACEANASNTGGGGSVSVDNSGDVPADTTDSTDTSGDVPADTTGTTDTTDSGEVATGLPTTGSGPTSGTGTTGVAVLALLSLMTLGAASEVNRRRA
jgi:hypothetical protein